MPPISTTASRMIESWMGKVSVNSCPESAASNPPATPVMKDARANAQSL